MVLLYCFHFSDETDSVILFKLFVYSNHIFLYIFEYILTAALKLLYVNSKIWTILRLFYIDFFFPDLGANFLLCLLKNILNEFLDISDYILLGIDYIFCLPLLEVLIAFVGAWL